MKSTYKIGLFLLIMCGVFYAETDEVKSVMEGDSVSLNLDLTQIQRLDLLLWRFGDKGSTIAQIDGNEISYEDYEVFRDRLELDQTGSLIITNTRSTDSGFYTVKISSRTQTVYKRFSVSVIERGLSSGAVAGIVLVFLAVVAAAAVPSVVSFVALPLSGSPAETW